MDETNPYEAPKHLQPQSKRWRTLTPAQVALLVYVVLVVLLILGLLGN